MAKQIIKHWKRGMEASAPVVIVNETLLVTETVTETKT